MQGSTPEIATVDAYIDQFPEPVSALLTELRATIRAAAPGADERISYRMPTFHLHGNLVHFAAFRHHVGFYPGPSAIEAFRDDLAGYRGAKGSVQFPLDQPLPLALVTRMVEFRVAENTRREAEWRKGKGARGATPDRA